MIRTLAAILTIATATTATAYDASTWYFVYMTDTACVYEQTTTDMFGNNVRAQKQTEKPYTGLPCPATISGSM